MDALVFSQTFFYLVVSFAIITLGIFAAIIAYHLIHITKRLEEISGDISNTSHDAREGIKELLEAFSRIPFLSFFTKRKSREGRKKGREKSR
mgnify:CR=1 FL=1